MDYNILGTSGNGIYNSVDAFAYKWIGQHYLLTFSLLVLVILYILYCWVFLKKGGFEGMNTANPIYSATPSINNQVLSDTIMTGVATKGSGDSSLPSIDIIDPSEQGCYSSPSVRSYEQNILNTGMGIGNSGVPQDVSDAGYEGLDLMPNFN